MTNLLAFTFMAWIVVMWTRHENERRGTTREPWKWETTPLARMLAAVRSRTGAPDATSAPHSTPPPSAPHSTPPPRREQGEG